jgi:hypothetical protein
VQAATVSYCNTNLQCTAYKQLQSGRSRARLHKKKTLRSDILTSRASTWRADAPLISSLTAATDIGSGQLQRRVQKRSSICKSFGFESRFRALLFALQDLR